MSKIDNLIQELCPDGVEYKILESVVKMHSGSFVKKDLQDDSYPYPVMNGGTGATGFYKEFNSNANCIAVSSRGANCGAINYMTQKFWAGNSCYVLDPISEEINGRYLYHVLACLLPAEVEKKKQVAGIPALNTKPLMQLLIPVPPIEVQEEIVRVLDSFAELEARRRQYAYYRDQLLTFNKPEIQRERDLLSKSVKWLALGDIGCFMRGSSFQKKDFRDKGVPCIHYGQIYTYYQLAASSTKSFLDEQTAFGKRCAHFGDLIIATTSENEEDVCKAMVWLGDTNVIVSNDACIFRHNLNPKYVAYFFSTKFFQEQKRSFITGTKVLRVSPKSLEKIKIPVPPLSEQQRIVDILDKFDALVNDISKGLPAEIEARRKQYEYYRDKLLTFKKKED